MKRQKVSKWRRYINLIFGVKSKPKAVAELKSYSEEPGSRCITEPHEAAANYERLPICGNAIYYSSSAALSPE